MIYPKNFHIVKYPLDFENTRERRKRVNIGFNYPILIIRNVEMFQNIIEYHRAMKQQGYSGALMHYQIDEEGLIYEGRDIIYQNGFADRNDIDADEYVKNAILIQVCSDDNMVLSRNKEVYKSLKNLVEYLCRVQLLCPVADIKDFGEFAALSSPSFQSDDFFDMKKSIMNDIFPTKKMDWKFAASQQYSLVVVPDWEEQYRTTTYISRCLAESMDYDKWNPIAENIKKSNKDVMQKIRSATYREYYPEDDFDVPIEPGTLVVAPPTKFMYFIESIRKNAGISLGKQLATNTIAASIYQISEEVKNMK